MPKTPACDERAFVIRAIAPDDADRLVAFHERLSSETKRLRFFSFHPHLQPEEVTRFVTVDGTHRAAVVAVSGGDIVGVARLDRDGDSEQAEIAVVVQDDLQRHGVGRRLLDALFDVARDVGLTRLTATTLPENNPVRELFRSLGYPMTSQYAAGVIEVSMQLDAPS